MVKKIDFFKKVPDAMKNLINMEDYFHKDSTVEPIIRELIKIRASQINGCAYCLNMHTIDAMKIGETAQRIFLTSAWWETELFNAKEKAALNLCEHLTTVSSSGVPEEVIEDVLEHFTEKEYCELVLMISQINTWNRINVSVHGDIDPSYK